MNDQTPISPSKEICEGELLWTPTQEYLASTSLARYMQWLASERDLTFDGYQDLWEWSVTEVEAFWGSLWEYFEINTSAQPECVLKERIMPGADWFPGARINYAEHILRNATKAAPALLHLNEREPLQALSWDSFASDVRRVATVLREAGIEPGDRVVAYLPNLPQTMVAMLATAAIGAIWSSCSPDFGVNGVLDRVQQLTPKLIFASLGYEYGGKYFDRQQQVVDIAKQLDSLEQLILVGNPQQRKPDATIFEQVAVDVKTWEALVERDDPGQAHFQFAQVPFSHPLWILFSSGTTGLPKPIIHCHGGILMEQLKTQNFHMDNQRGDVVFFYTTTGWMVWNALASVMLTGAIPVLYDGNPSFPDVDVLWRMVQDSKASFFGSSPTFVEIMRRQGIVPKERFDLSSLRAIMLTGSVVSPEISAWPYQYVKEDLWTASGSGGTDVCSGIVGGVPILPVRAGEIQAPCLGVAARSYSDNGRSVTDEVGELVITQPMPSMPVGFWGDTDNERYHDSYFDLFPGIWRHGDFIRINARNGCFMHGRSDATLNRYGIRIGTAEIYRALDTLPEITDSIIVNLDLPGGQFFMPLFIQLAEGANLDDALQTDIKRTLKEKCTPRHVPDKIYSVSTIPTTLTGKKMEVPVRKILMGVPFEKAANVSAMRDPDALNYFVDFAATSADYTLS